jgi:hypothetical protein
MAVFEASVGALHVAAPTQRSCTHVYYHDPNETPIVVCQVPGLHRVEVQRPIFMAGSYPLTS